MLRTMLVTAALGWALSAVPAQAQDTSVRWSVTVNASMTQPMSMRMPSYSSETCGPARPDKEPPPMKDGDCSVEDYSQSDNRVSYKVVCNTQSGNMTGDGWAEMIDADNYRGHMIITGNGSGMPIEMSMEYTGKRIGSCEGAEAE